MNDLNIIQRKNAESMALDIPPLRASGRWVVAVYLGLHYAEHCDFGTEVEASQEIEKRARANPYERTQLLAPTEQPVAASAPVVVVETQTANPADTDGVMTLTNPDTSNTVAADLPQDAEALAI